MDSTIDKDALLSDGEEDVTEEELNTPIVLTDRDLGLMTLCHGERSTDGSPHRELLEDRDEDRACGA